jgi:chromosome segregation ATPase
MQMPPRNNTECADYEAELNEFRRQMETDRQALDKDIEQFRTRTAELHEAVRDAELELSRERAQLARERLQLDRLREEIRQELERGQRDASHHHHLAPVQRLKEELNERHLANNQQETVIPTTRWRNFLNKLGEIQSGILP